MITETGQRKYIGCIQDCLKKQEDKRKVREIYEEAHEKDGVSITLPGYDAYNVSRLW